MTHPHIQCRTTNLRFLVTRLYQVHGGSPCLVCSRLSVAAQWSVASNRFAGPFDLGLPGHWALPVPCAGAREAITIAVHQLQLHRVLVLSMCRHSFVYAKWRHHPSLRHLNMSTPFFRARGCGIWCMCFLTSVCWQLHLGQDSWHLKPAKHDLH